jgi:predicted TPR repeat methyltransferase
MSDLDRARSLFAQGVELFEAGQLPAAQDCFEQALVLAPGRPSVLLNLGITRMRLGRWEDSIEPLQQSLAAQADSVDGWLALGMALYRLGRLDEALAAYRQVLEREPSQALAWGESASVLREMEQPQEAIAHYERALALWPEHELYRYYLSALRGEPGPPQAPREYVMKLFDQYADDFESHLVGTLHYRGHRHLIEHLPAAAPTRFERVLDLGCGTGLCGPLIRARAGILWGVDLAPGMVDKSRALGVYDHLAQGDATEFLLHCEPRWDLVLASDVLIYVGALEALFEALSAKMQPGGWLAFTAERCDAQPNEAAQPRLLPSLRYAHPLSYLQATAARHGWVWHSHHEATLRLHEGQPMPALYAYLQRRADAA